MPAEVGILLIYFPISFKAACEAQDKRPMLQTGTCKTALAILAHSKIYICISSLNMPSGSNDHYRINTHHRGSADFVIITGPQAVSLHNYAFSEKYSLFLTQFSLHPQIRVAIPKADYCC